MSVWTKNQVRGVVGDVDSGDNLSTFIKFKAGYTMPYDSSALRCNYANSTCYRAKGVPAIHYIDKQSGYTTGGQLITV